LRASHPTRTSRVFTAHQATSTRPQSDSSIAASSSLPGRRLRSNLPRGGERGKRCSDWRIWNRQKPWSHRYRCPSNREPQRQSALLFHRRTGQCIGTGKGSGEAG
jgi:hypothetical protein